MAHWLFKEEPSHYSFSDLVRDGRTTWDGIRNPLARKNLRAARARDTAFFYHSGTERAVVGIMEVLGAARPDPQDQLRAWSVPVKAVRPLRVPVTLAQLKSDPALEGSDLLRIPRLSVMPVSERQWRTILRYERGPSYPRTNVAARTD